LGAVVGRDLGHRTHGMRLARMAKNRLRWLLRRNAAEVEMDEELRLHLEHQIEANIDAGMSPADARNAALREFGNIGIHKEQCRDAKGTTMIDNLVQDTRYALRSLRRDPILALTAAVTLAVCIGANTTVFSLIDTVLLRPLPYPGSERIVWVSEHFNGSRMDVGLGPDYYSMREEGRLFEEVGAYNAMTVNWAGVEKPEQLDAALTTPSFFGVFGSRPLLGRYLAANEEGAKAAPVAVLSYAFWRSRLGSDAHVVGKTITLDGLANTIIGVMPQGFDYPKGTQVWKPIEMDRATQFPRLVTRPVRILNIVARVKPGVTRPQLDAEMARLTHVIHNEYPKDFERMGFLKGMSIMAVPLQERIAGNLKPALAVLSGAVALVLLIACVNLANLLLARAGARQRDIAIRLALGSDRGRVVRQMLTESILLAVPGGIAGVLVAAGAVSALNAIKPLVLDRYPAIALDSTTLLFTVAVTLITGVIFGMAPAFAAARTDVQDALKAAGLTHSSAKGAAKLRRVLVAAELAVCLVLLIGAGLLGKSFLKLAQTEIGFAPERLLTFAVNLNGSRYVDGPGQVQFYDQALQNIRRLPSVQSAAVATNVPLGAGTFSSMVFQVVGRAPLPLAQQPSTDVEVVSADFFRTLAIPLLSGRIFGAQDSPASPNDIVVNQAFARRIFPGEDPIGRSIVNGPALHRYTIVGVVGSVRSANLGEPPPTVIYHCLRQGGNQFLQRMKFIVRTSGDPAAAVRDAEAAVYAVDRNQPVFDVKTMEQRLSDALAPQRFDLLLIGAFAAIAIVLAAAGVYGVMSYLITRRSREMGIRLAMGARAEDILQLLIGESLALVIVAVIGGLGGAWALTRYAKSMLYGVTALDVETFAITPIILAVVVIAASLGPALRASRIDPIQALREE